MEKGEPEITESKSLDSQDRKGFIEEFLKIKGVSEFMSPEGKFTKTKTKDIPISPTKSEEDKEEVTSLPDKDKDNNMSKSDTWIPTSPTMGDLF